MDVEPTTPAEPPRDSGRAPRRALLFGPLLLVVGVVVVALGVPWPVVAAAVALFVVWLLVEG